MTEGSLAGQVPRPVRQSDRAGSSYARPHPSAGPPPAADPSANRLGPAAHQPRAQAEEPPGHLLVKLANAGRTSAGGHKTRGDIVCLPAAEAAELVRAGRAWRVTAQ